MVKVKKDLIAKVICLGVVQTRRFTYFCNGRVSFDPFKNEPLVYVVFRVKSDAMKESIEERIEYPVKVVGLFDMKGNRL